MLIKKEEILYVVNKYEFKTLVSLAKFLGISEVQLNRYIDKECKSDHKFTFIY